MAQEQPKESSPKAAGDGPKTAKDDPETIFRIYSVLSYFIVLVIIGLPVWWYTTRVYRADLPLDAMYREHLHNRTNKEYGLPLSLEYDILITMVNPEPSSLKIDIRGQEIEQYLQPFLAKLSPIADFTVKSQWLYLVELGAIPRKIDDHFGLQENQLPHIISPLEKKLFSNLSPRPCINLVLYFPQCRTPLHIYNSRDEKSSTNAMLSPSWGGISIINSDRDSCEKHVFKPDVGKVAATFQAQLQRLFRIPELDEEHITELKREKAEHLLDSTRRTLKSLAQLLSEISSIVIGDEVARQIESAVRNADLAEDKLRTDVDAGLRYAKLAYEKAEKAFSDPSLLALLYFPDDQKYAVYIPLFLPVMIPVLMSLIGIRKYFVGKDQKVKTE